MTGWFQISKKWMENLHSDCATGWMIGGSSPGKGWKFFSPSQLGPTHPTIQGEAGSLSLGQSGRGVKLPTHLHLVARSRMRGAIPPFLPVRPQRGARFNHRDNFTFKQIIRRKEKEKYI
jgi:hypothetical protein